MDIPCCVSRPPVSCSHQRCIVELLIVCVVWGLACQHLRPQRIGAVYHVCLIPLRLPASSTNHAGGPEAHKKRWEETTNNKKLVIHIAHIHAHDGAKVMCQTDGNQTLGVMGTAFEKKQNKKQPCSDQRDTCVMSGSTCKPLHTARPLTQWDWTCWHTDTNHVIKRWEEQGFQQHVSRQNKIFVHDLDMEYMSVRQITILLPWVGFSIFVLLPSPISCCRSLHVVDFHTNPIKIKEKINK